MSALPAAVHVAPSARVLTASSAALRGKLGALTMFVIVGLVSVCLWTGYPVDLMPQSRRLPVIAIMGMVACAIGLPLSRNRGPDVGDFRQAAGKRSSGLGSQREHLGGAQGPACTGLGQQQPDGRLPLPSIGPDGGDLALVGGPRLQRGAD